MLAYVVCVLLIIGLCVLSAAVFYWFDVWCMFIAGLVASALLVGGAAGLFVGTIYRVTSASDGESAAVETVLTVQD